MDGWLNGLWGSKYLLVIKPHHYCPLGFIQPNVLVPVLEAYTGHLPALGVLSLANWSTLSSICNNHQPEGTCGKDGSSLLGSPTHLMLSKTHPILPYVGDNRLYSTLTENTNNDVLLSNLENPVAFKGSHSPRICSSVCAPLNQKGRDMVYLCQALRSNATLCNRQAVQASLK